MTPNPPDPNVWRQRLIDMLLLPLVLLIIFIEDVVWRGSQFLLRRLVAQPAVERLRQWLGRLPAWAALPLFLIPEMAARVGDLWFAVLLYEERFTAAVIEYALVRVVATLVAVFIWHACADALLSLRWLAWVVKWIAIARVWSLAGAARLRGCAPGCAGWSSAARWASRTGWACCAAP